MRCPPTVGENLCGDPWWSPHVVQGGDPGGVLHPMVAVVGAELQWFHCPSGDLSQHSAHICNIPKVLQSVKTLTDGSAAY